MNAQLTRPRERVTRRLECLPLGPFPWFPRHQLDVYRHRSHPPDAPTLVYLHGGGFFSGRKSREALPLFHRLASQGWVCISANNRLRPVATFPDHLIDAKKVIAWVREHGDEYGADPAAVTSTPTRDEEPELRRPERVTVGMLRLAQLACAAVMVLVMQGTAYGSVVSVTTTQGWDGEPVLEGKLHYTAVTGESNRLRVEQAPEVGGLLFSDTGVEQIFEAEDGCEQVTPQQVVCKPNPYEDVYDLDITLGDKADRTLVLSTDLDAEPGGFLPLELYGGKGPDVLRTRVLSAKVFGQGGKDRISAMKGRPRDRENLVSCGPGQDLVFVDRTFSADADDCEKVVRRKR